MKFNVSLAMLLSMVSLLLSIAEPATAQPFGFKGLTLGMTESEVQYRSREPVEGTKMYHRGMFWTSGMLHYRLGPEPYNIGEFQIGSLDAYFYQDRVFWIQISTGQIGLDDSEKLTESSRSIIAAVTSKFGKPTKVSDQWNARAKHPLEISDFESMKTGELYWLASWQTPKKTKQPTSEIIVSVRRSATGYLVSADIVDRMAEQKKNGIGGGGF